MSFLVCARLSGPAVSVFSEWEDLYEVPNLLLFAAFLDLSFYSEMPLRGSTDDQTCDCTMALTE